MAPAGLKGRLDKNADVSKGKVAKKSENTHICTGSPSEPQTENENRFFRFQAEDLLNPRMVWIAL